MSGAKLDEDKSIYVTHISECKFRRPVIPGDVLILNARIERHKMGLWMFSCDAKVGEVEVSAARITATTGPKVKSPPLPPGLPPPPRF